MNKRNFLSIACLVIAAGAYIFFFTDWFRPHPIEIFHTSRPRAHYRRGHRVNAAPETPTVQFGLVGTYRLTEIKVVPLDQWKTNSAVLPMWHLVSDSNSVPVKFFRYGQRIRGMKPEVANSRAKPLELGTTYRLFVKAGSSEGEHDFTAVLKSAEK